MSIDDGEFIQMNAMTDIDAAHHFAKALENAEAKRLGIRTKEARRVLARRLRTSPGTLENIRRLRTKIVLAWLMSRIRSEFVSLLHAEILRLENEINLARQIGASYCDDSLQEAEAQMASAKEILRLAQ